MDDRDAQQASQHGTLPLYGLGMGREASGLKLGSAFLPILELSVFSQLLELHPTTNVDRRWIGLTTFG